MAKKHNPTYDLINQSFIAVNIALTAMKELEERITFAKTLCNVEVRNLREKSDELQKEIYKMRNHKSL